MNRNIFIAYILTFLRNSWFWLGIWVFYYLKFTNYAGIGLIETSLIIAMTISEIPTGAIADLFGKKVTLTISFLLQTIGMGMLAFAPQVSWLIIGVFIAGIGGSFYSGTVDALLYDTLKEIGEEKKFDKVISRVTSISLIAPAVCGIIGGFLYYVSPNLPFIAHTLFYFIGIPLTFLLIEPKVKEANNFSFKNFVKQTHYGFRELFKNNFVIEQTILLLSAGVIIVICDEMLNSFLGVEFKFNPAQLAILWSIIYLVSSFASHATPYFKKFMSYRNFAVWVGIFIALSLLVSPIAGMIFGGISLLVRSSLQAVYSNVSSILVNETTESKYRTTTLSTFNLLKNVPYVLTAYYLGSLADHYSAIKIAFFLGIALAILIILQTIIYMKRQSGRHTSLASEAK